MANSYQVLFKLESDPQISVREVQSSRQIDGELEKLCQERWQKTVSEAAAQNRKIWDSEIYRWESFELNDNNLQLNFSVIPFSIRVSMSEYTDRVRQLGLKYSPLGLYSSCFVVSADGKFLFIEKSKIYYSSRKAAFVGGVFSKSEQVIDSEAVFFSAVEREVVEELEVGEDEIEKTTFDAGYISENFNVCLIFTVYLNRTFHEIIDRFKGGSESETDNIIGVERTDLADFALTMQAKDLPKFEICGYQS